MMLISIYGLSITILLILQSSVANRFNQYYAGKKYFLVYPKEALDLIDRNNNYVEYMELLIPCLNHKEFYIKRPSISEVISNLIAKQ